jgi:hypothetical protein
MMRRYHHGFGTMPFGQYKGCAIEALPHDYLTWLAEHENMRSGASDTLAVVQSRVTHRPKRASPGEGKAAGERK